MEEMTWVPAEFRRETEKAILVEWQWSHLQTWLPKSQITALQPEGESILVVGLPQWLHRKYRAIAGHGTNGMTSIIAEIDASATTKRIA